MQSDKPTHALASPLFMKLMEEAAPRRSDLTFMGVPIVWNTAIEKDCSVLYYMGRDGIIDKMIQHAFGVHNLKAQNERLRDRLRQAESAGSNWDREQELVGLRELVKRMTPQKQFRILAKGPCLPGTSVRETRFLDITSVASTEGVTTISVDAPWLLPKGGTP